MHKTNIHLHKQNASYQPKISLPKQSTMTCLLIWHPSPPPPPQKTNHRLSKLTGPQSSANYFKMLLRINETMIMYFKSPLRVNSICKTWRLATKLFFITFSSTTLLSYFQLKKYSSANEVPIVLSSLFKTTYNNSKCFQNSR